MKKFILIFAVCFISSLTLSGVSFASDDDAVDLSGAGDNTPVVYSPSLNNTTPAGMAPGQPIEKCSVCYGEGKVDCYACKGKGTQKCDICHESGEVRYKNDAGDWIEEVCNSCRGNGYYTCTNCNGSPYSTCPICHGEGHS
jgi:hypothetical protein